MIAFQCSFLFKILIKRPIKKIFTILPDVNFFFSSPQIKVGHHRFLLYVPISEHKYLSNTNIIY